MQLLYRSFSWLGADRLLWKTSARQLRILCYHGVCEDRVAGEPWIPGYFVAESAFHQQLRYLRECANVLPLAEAVVRLRENTLPERPVTITFDDGYANNLSLAYRLLKELHMSATVFLASAYTESGELYPFLKLNLLRLYSRVDFQTAPEYKSSPLQDVLAWTDPKWPEVYNRLTKDQVETLRPLTIQEVQDADSDLIEFGSHTHTHCILRNETAERRSEEICESIRKIASWTGKSVRLFSYPNGERRDFGEQDRKVLRSEGIEAAVTGIPGSNKSATDPLELRRFPVGLYHDYAGFRAEASGLRAMLLAARAGFGS